jgi:hypothetical protein
MVTIVFLDNSQPESVGRAAQRVYINLNVPEHQYDSLGQGTYSRAPDPFYNIRTGPYYQYEFFDADEFFDAEENPVAEWVRMRRHYRSAPVFHHVCKRRKMYRNSIEQRYASKKSGNPRLPLIKNKILLT